MNDLIGRRVVLVRVGISGFRSAQRLQAAGRLRIISAITEPELTTKILAHIQNRDPPRRAPRHALPHFEPNGQPFTCTRKTVREQPTQPIDNRPRQIL